MADDPEKILPTDLPDAANTDAANTDAANTDAANTNAANMNAADANATDRADINEQHRKMAAKRNAGYEKKQAQATREKGLLIVITGTGKGKTTSALGMGLRAVGHHMRLGVVQFIKGAKETAEREVFARFAHVEWYTIGDGFTWITQNRAQDIATAQTGWQYAARLISNPHYDMVILDELNTVLKYDYLPLATVLQTVQARPPMQHVIITGRHAPAALIEIADLVSDIRPIKHPYREQGIKAQKGIEF